MRTRRSYFPPTATISRPSRKHTSNLVEPEIQTIVEMADNRTMAQMLQAPIEGYEDAIVVPPINANNFELKQTLINLVQINQFTGRQYPHNHLRFFNKVTSTFRHPKVPNTTIKLLLFPFSLEGEARIWLDKELPHSILTWEDLVSKFINQFFPPSKTTYLRNEITNFLQKPNETFNEAWERFKDLLRQCPHHGFSELHQLDTFYNVLNPNDQDALDSAAGGNFLNKIPRECLSIIESKSKVRYSRSQVTNLRANTNALPSSSSPSNSLLYLNQGNNHENVQRNNQGRNQFFQGASHGQNPSPVYQAPANQSPGYQDLVQQAPIPQLQVVTTTEFTNYMKMNAASSSGSGTLPSNTITNPKEDLKDRSISRSVGVAADVFIKVETFHFPADFVVVDFDVDPRVLLILKRSFLKTERTLIDVYAGELTLRVGNKAITFNLDQTSRYSANYDAMSVNRIDLIDVACEEYSQEVLIFSVKTDAFLAIDDEPISPKIDESYYDLEGDILLLEEFLNDDSSSPPLPPQELKVVEPNNKKSSIDEPPVVELKDLPPHFEYAFWR
nr:reverse transcriptase domain-containing protein [Tanacetum cinerariifolium]